MARNFKICETLYIVPLFFSDKLTGEKMAMLLWLGHKTMPPHLTPTLCVEMGFTWMFFGKQNASADIKFEVILIRFLVLKVIKSQKQFMVSSILPKNEQKNSTLLL